MHTETDCSKYSVTFSKPYGLTNPLAVLAFRWINAVQSDEPLFHPGYELT